MKIFITCIVAVFLIAATGCGKKAEKPEVSPVKIEAGEKSAPFEGARAEFVSPKDGALLKPGAVSVEVQVTNYDLGKQTETERAKEIANSGEGQHVHIIVDNQPYKACYDAATPFDIGELSEGVHTLVVFPSRSYHEAVKSKDGADVITVYVGKKEGTPMLTPDQPAVIYSRPKGEYAGEGAKKIMLDFYLHNVQLSPDGFKARYTVDGQHSIVLTDWQPAFVKGLADGKHTILLELLDKDNNLVDGAFNRTTREITVTQADSAHE